MLVVGYTSNSIVNVYSKYTQKDYSLFFYFPGYHEHSQFPQRAIWDVRARGSNCTTITLDPSNLKNISKNGLAALILVASIYT